MVPAVALALMAGRALAAEPQKPDFSFLKPLLEFFDLLDRSWLGTAVVNYDPNGWNGVWPKGSVK
jgi:hypothetical protein